MRLPRVYRVLEMHLPAEFERVYLIAPQLLQIHSIIPKSEQDNENHFEFVELSQLYVYSVQYI